MLPESGDSGRWARKVVPLDYLVAHQSRETTPSKEYVTANSVRRSLRRCMQWSPCNVSDCPHCGERLARNAIKTAQERFSSFARCDSFRFSVARNVNLAEAFRELAVVLSLFLGMARLGRSAGGYLISTEVTRTALGMWNAHLHMLVFDCSDAEERLPKLWERAAAKLGCSGSWHHRQSATEPAIDYVLKFRLGSGKGSLRQLLSRAAHGDALAADAWAEWDRWRAEHPHAQHRRPWLSARRPEKPKRQPLPDYSDAELARVSILAALGVHRADDQGAALGLSRPTIYRQRQHFGEQRLGNPGRIYFRFSER